MKFYELLAVDGDPWSQESSFGQWATRADAEQAAKDAVAMAQEVQQFIKLFCYERGKVMEYKEKLAWIKSEAIIERYEGGKP